MANKNLFGSAAKTQRHIDQITVPATGTNAAGGAAYEFAPQRNEAGEVQETADGRLALAQYCATGTLASTYYMDEKAHLETVLKLVAEVDDLFLAKAAIWSRKEAFLKDMPALLLASLAARGADTKLVEAVWMEVVDGPKMVRNVLQILRSGALAGPDGRPRRTIPRRIRSLTETWLQVLTPYQLLNASVGTDPSLADIINMVHPRPFDAHQRAAFAWVRKDLSPTQKAGKKDRKTGACPTYAEVPLPMRGFDALKMPGGEPESILEEEGREALIRRLDHRLLTSLPLSTKDWADVARGAKWHALRMNLATFARHGVFRQFPKLVSELADRLRDAETIRKAKAYPYQCLVAYRQLEHNDDVPRELKDALQDALDLCCENVPKIDGAVHVFVDVSGSMNSPVTGRNNKPSVATCRDVAALIASATLRANPSAKVYGFTTELFECSLNPRDSLMTNVSRLSELPWGATDCSVGLRYLAEVNRKVDTVIIASDYESWFDPGSLGQAPGRSTSRLYAPRAPSMAQSWETLRLKHQSANGGAGPRLICCDLQPRTDHQVREDPHTLFVGGWSDRAFDLIHEFVSGNMERRGYAQRIEKIELG